MTTKHGYQSYQQLIGNLSTQKMSRRAFIRGKKVHHCSSLAPSELLRWSPNRKTSFTSVNKSSVRLHCLARGCLLRVSAPLSPAYRSCFSILVRLSASSRRLCSGFLSGRRCPGDRDVVLNNHLPYLRAFPGRRCAASPRRHRPHAIPWLRADGWRADTVQYGSVPAGEQ